MVNIQDLPTELLHNIIGFVAEDDDLRKPPPERVEPEDSDDEEGWRIYNHGLDPWDIPDWSDLVEVCLVSHQFCDLAQPFLFRKFTDQSITGLGKTITFAATLCRRPDLGKYVEQIYIDPNTYGWWTMNFLHGNRFTQMAADLKAAVKDLQIGDEQERAWCSSIDRRNLGVILALLLSKTPNLQSLRLPGGQFSHEPIDLLFGQDPSYLANLKVLWVECKDDSFPAHDISKIERFLTLPMLQLAGFSYGNLSSASFPSTWTEKSLSADRLEFSQCHIDGDALSKLTRACKSLQSFTYKNFRKGVDIPSPGLGVEFNASQAHDALLPHKDTLEVLTLGCYRGPQPDIQNYLHTQIKIDPLDDFCKLRIISIPHAMLPAHPVFPSSLERLTILDCRSSTRNIVQNVAKDVRNGKYPKLVQCKVLTPDRDAAVGPCGGSNGKSYLDCYRSLSAIFRGAGHEVDFTVWLTDSHGRMIM